jgi:hypothetical protein
MKALLSICMMFYATLVFAGERVSPPALTAASGEVLEVRNVESYTYLRLNTAKGEVWAAIDKAGVRKGDKVVIENAMVMNNFESKSLKKTFKTILFGTLAGESVRVEPSSRGSDIHVDKAVGENALTIEEIVSRAVELKDKAVLVRGKIVKYNAAIMGKNWIHLRDGSGKSENNDLLVTSSDQARVGDVVTVKGMVRTDRDFGAGYSYKVVIEDATLQQ